MSAKSKPKTILQKIGIALFVLAMGIFIASLTMSTFRLDKEAIKSNLSEYHYGFAAPHLEKIEGESYSNSFTFMSAYNTAMKAAQADILQDVETNLGLTTSDGEYWNKILKDDKIKSTKFPVAKASSGGMLVENSWLIFFLSIGLGVIGALLYILPQKRHLPGIKNNHIYHSPMHNKGWLGIVTGIYLIAFYIILYFYPQHLVNWVIMVDPISEVLSGEAASQWFLYGFLYTLAILVMGIRMFIKYRHNRYQLIRTGSVMFFQLSFAFLIPQILTLLDQPSMDLKNMWPLDYYFFYDYRIDKLIGSGNIGLFMLVWGIALFMVGVPVLTYFYGKRWYCSWVCGCGGLAETLGDPYRQLSDKSLRAWQVERWLIHAVLVFVVVMTIAVLYVYLPAVGGLFTKSNFLYLMVALLAGVAVVFYLNSNKLNGIPKVALFGAFGVVGAMIAILLVNHFSGRSELFFVQSYSLRQWYGFAIGSIFAGVIGTGFYPLMGNRVWCRFGCPLAAYLGLVQKLKSRFRITSNGSQCISCGNCSTYCEMGIDVRWYAQRGQDIVRSSCVGCGVCSAVCPRGVLRLENGSSDINDRTGDLRAIHIKEGEVVLLGNEA
jgi:ferredoxin-type protein NapH